MFLMFFVLQFRFFFLASLIFQKIFQDNVSNSLHIVHFSSSHIAPTKQKRDVAHDSVARLQMGCVTCHYIVSGDFYDTQVMCTSILKLN